MFRYLKYYFEPKHKDVRELAIAKAKVHYKDKNVSMAEFQGYQQGYIGAYRTAHAKAQMQKFRALNPNK
jgi:hypothetical protein